MDEGWLVECNYDNKTSGQINYHAIQAMGLLLSSVHFLPFIWEFN